MLHQTFLSIYMLDCYIILTPYEMLEMLGRRIEYTTPPWDLDGLILAVNVSSTLKTTWWTLSSQYLW